MSGPNAEDISETFKKGMINLTSAGKDMFDQVGSLLNKSPEEQTVEIIIFIIIALIVLIFIVWAANISTLNQRDCARLDNLYNTIKTTMPISTRESSNSSVYTANKVFFEGSHATVNAYYVKTAYNCCSPGDMKNSFVELCALKKCIQLGARCLDFEIYSENGKPVVATSIVDSNLVDSYYIKQTFNSIDLADVLYTIYYYAFDNHEGGAPNFSDPLFIHMRIMTDESKTIDLIAKYLGEIMSDKLLGIEYGNANYGNSMAPLNLLQFSNKCIVMMYNNRLSDMNTQTIRNSKLYPLINILTNTDEFKLFRNSQLSSEDNSDIVTHNKYYMTMVLPDLSPSSSNYNPTKAFQAGCQFIGMHFQNFDTNLEYYFELFDELRYAYILKECSMRHFPTHYLVDKASNPGAACATEQNTDFGGISIRHTIPPYNPAQPEQQTQQTQQEQPG